MGTDETRWAIADAKKASADWRRWPELHYTLSPVASVGLPVCQPTALSLPTLMRQLTGASSQRPLVTPGRARSLRANRP
jgi:hypothetical protein